MVHAVAVQTEAEVDAKRLEDREQWYVARFCADDAPDWNAAQFVSRYPLIEAVPPQAAPTAAAALSCVIAPCDTSLVSMSARASRRWRELASRLLEQRLAVFLCCR